MSSEPAHIGARRVPDFFVVGHPKCGTTALYEMLARHPQIFMSAIKEPRFFASDMRQRFQPSRAGALPDTLERYLDLFESAAPEQLAGEASPSYLASHTAAGLIAEVQPEARIVAILREPAAFLRSLHQQLLRSHVETKKDLRKAIALEGARAEGRRIPRRSHRPGALQYSDHVRYVEQLRRYEAVFPAEQMLVLIYEDFRADNERTLRKVLSFLGVDDTVALEVHDANPAVRLRSQQLDELVHMVSVGRRPADQNREDRAEGRDAARGSPSRATGDATARRLRPAQGARRGVHGRAAPPLQGRGGRSERAPRPRPGEALGV